MMIMKLKRLKATFDFSQIGEDIAVICMKAGWVKTKSEARRVIASGGIRLEDIPITDPLARLVFDGDKDTFFLLEKEL